jgi:hypothetical protein
MEKTKFVQIEKVFVSHRAYKTRSLEQKMNSSLEGCVRDVSVCYRRVVCRQKSFRKEAVVVRWKKK